MREARPLGTHIDAFFPHAVERSPEAVLGRLLTALGRVSDDLGLIRARGRFSCYGGGWSVWSDDGTVSGEGPDGLSISVYLCVVEFTSVERFVAVARPDLGIHWALRRVFEVVASAFGAGGHLAVAPGGFGHTDRAGDSALAGAGFADVCECLQRVIGSPARSWAALEAGAGQWYLSAPQAEEFTAAGGDGDPASV